MSQYKLGYLRPDDGRKNIIHMIAIDDDEDGNKRHIFYTDKPGETIGDLRQKIIEVLGLESIELELPDDMVISSDLIIRLPTSGKGKVKEEKEEDKKKEYHRIFLLNTNDSFMISNASPSHSFWEMIAMNDIYDISLIVFIDDGEHDNLYSDIDTGSDKIYKNIVISTSSVSRESSFSEIGVKVRMNEKKEKDITILHYNGWKKNGIPDMQHFQSFLTSYSEIRNRHKNHEMIYSADLERPGIFLACVDLLTSRPPNEDGSPGENNRNLFDITKRLLIQVPLNVNDLQSKFLGDVMLTRMTEIDVTKKFDEKMSIAIIYFKRNFYQQCRINWEGKWYNNSIKFPYTFYPMVLISIVKNTFEHLKICRDREEEKDSKCFIGDIVDDEEYASLVFYNGDGCAMYKKGDQMGHKSAFGVVYHTCCGEEEPCHHITKIVKFSTDYDIKQEQANFHKEVMLQQKVAKAGLAPAIVTSYITPTQGIIVMEKMNKTLLDHMNEYLIYAQYNSLSSAEIEKTARIFAINMGDLLIRLHQQGIYHSDAHVNNVMTNKNNRLIFIDFGHATSDQYDDKVNRPRLNEVAEIMFDKEYRQIPNIRTDYITNKDPHTQVYVFMKEYIRTLERIKNEEERALIRGEKLEYDDKIRQDFADIIKLIRIPLMPPTAPLPQSQQKTEILPLHEPAPPSYVDLQENNVEK